MAYYLGMATLFMQFTVLPQVLGYVFQANLYLPYLINLPALMAMIVSGGFRMCYRSRPGYYWTAFGCWMWLAAPFSVWRGASVTACFYYWRSALSMVFIVAAMIHEWSDVKKVMNVIAASAVVNVLCALFIRMDAGDRIGVALGSIGNPNDYAGHLLLVLPFLLWVLLAGKAISRVVALGCIGFGLYLILGTSSRGALVALAVDVVFWAIMGTGRQKAALVLVGPIAAMILLATVPAHSLRRLSVIWNGSANTAEAAEALQSSAARQYTLTTSIRYTFEHPLFGVGPQEFSLYEGGHEQMIGTHGYWHETHNTYTEVSAECGIPGFIFFTGGIVSTLLLLYKTLRQARRQPGCNDIRVAVFCIMLGMVGFTAAITFLNFAYFFYLPAMAGLATGVWAAGQREFELRAAASGAVPA
jgi:O-antigen ligase